MNQPEEQCQPAAEAETSFDLDHQLGQILISLFPDVERRCYLDEDCEGGWISGCQVVFHTVEAIREAASKGNEDALVTYAEGLDGAVAALGNEQAEPLGWCLLERLPPETIEAIQEIGGPALNDLLAYVG